MGGCRVGGCSRAAFEVFPRLLPSPYDVFRPIILAFVRPVASAFSDASRDELSARLFRSPVELSRVKQPSDPRDQRARDEDREFERARGAT
jgi:hypothetical protein